MRDGVKLFTSMPKDTSTPYPFMIVRTPFGVGPYGSDKRRTIWDEKCANLPGK